MLFSWKSSILLIKSDLDMDLMDFICPGKNSSLRRKGFQTPDTDAITMTIRLTSTATQIYAPTYQLMLLRSQIRTNTRFDAVMMTCIFQEHADAKGVACLV